MMMENNRSNYNRITYFIYCINKFAAKHKLSAKDSFNYLHEFGGMLFLDEFYDVEHLLSFNDAIEDLTLVCKNNGGYLQ